MNAVKTSADKILAAIANRAAFNAANPGLSSPIGKKDLAAAAGVSLRTVGRQLPKLIEAGKVIEGDTGFEIIECASPEATLTAEQMLVSMGAPRKDEAPASPTVGVVQPMTLADLTPEHFKPAFVNPHAKEALAASPASARATSVPRTRERAILTLIASDDPMSLNDIVAGLAAAGDGCSPVTVKTTTYLIRRLGWLSREGAKGAFSVTEAGHAALAREKAAPKPRTSRKSYKSRVAAARAYIATIPNQSSDIVEALTAILAP